MKVYGDYGFELYMPAKGFGDPSQYQNGQTLARTVDIGKIARSADITPLSGFGDLKHFFNIIKEADSKLQLPFLAVFHGCETCAFVGHSGMEEVLDAIQEYGLLGDVRIC
jgi:hypothetical protein